MDETFGSILKTARDRVGLTQRDVADHLGLTTPYISQVESGARAPLAELAVTKLTGLLRLAPVDVWRLGVARLRHAGFVLLKCGVAGGEGGAGPSAGPSAEACAALADVWSLCTDDDVSVLVGRARGRAGAGAGGLPAGGAVGKGVPVSHAVRLGVAGGGVFGAPVSAGAWAAAEAARVAAGGAAAGTPVRPVVGRRGAKGGAS